MDTTAVGSARLSLPECAGPGYMGIGRWSSTREDDQGADLRSASGREIPRVEVRSALG